MWRKPLWFCCVVLWLGSVFSAHSHTVDTTALGKIFDQADLQLLILEEQLTNTKASLTGLELSLANSLLKISALEMEVEELKLSLGRSETKLKQVENSHDKQESILGEQNSQLAILEDSLDSVEASLVSLEVEIWLWRIVAAGSVTALVTKIFGVW